MFLQITLSLFLLLIVQTDMSYAQTQPVVTKPSPTQPSTTPPTGTPTTSPMTTKIPIPATSSSKDTLNIDYFDWTDSFMFPTTATRQLADALLAKETGKAIAEAAPPTAEQSAQALAVEKQIPKKAPIFFLDSILYINTSEWSVWVNSKKISMTPNDDDRIAVQAIYPEMVDLVWETDYLDNFMPNWRLSMKRNEYGEYVSLDEQVRVSPEGNKVYFSLKPNQSFLSNSLTIVEGHAKEL